MKIIAPPEVYQGVSFVKSGKRPFGLLPLFLCLGFKSSLSS
jgi:hypothetical protein